MRFDLPGQCRTQRPLPRRVRRGRGMTLIEMILSLAVIGSVLGVLVTVSESLRTDNAELHTRATLSVLRTALLAYHQKHEDWPADSTHLALAALLAEPESDSVIRRAGTRFDPVTGQLSVRDGYGRAIHYVTAGGQADFVSAGADGRLGDPASGSFDERAAAADNLYGAEMEAPRP